MNCLFMDFSNYIFILHLIINKYVEDKQEQGERHNDNVESGWLVEDNYNYYNYHRCLGEIRMSRLVCFNSGLTVELRVTII